jgi:catechol 2,3-dioxygenase-like lactoylglutathione lyase family enzyme
LWRPIVTQTTTIQIDQLDHLVLTVADIERSCAFYRKALNMKVLNYGDSRKALGFGDQKINLHQIGLEISPRARHPTPGAADLCFTTTTPIPQVMKHLRSIDVTIETGPVTRVGARGSILSVYFRDPDGNLLEVSNNVPGT